MTGGSEPAREAEEQPTDPGAPGTRDGTPVPVGGQGEDTWDGYDRRRPTTAEQAVPWLIGVILLLTGIVIVLLALIFTTPGGVARPRGGPTSEVLGGAAGPSLASPAVTPLAGPLGSPPASLAPTDPAASPTAPAPAEAGPLELVYLGRAAPLQPIYLLRKDFTTTDDPEVLALAEPGIQGYAWATTGEHGVVLAAQRAVAIEAQADPRSLGDGITAVALSPDGGTVFAVRPEAAGSDEIAHVLAIDFPSGETRELAAPRYPLPQIVHESPLSEAQFIDEGGTYRLYWLEDETIILSVATAGAWRIDPQGGGATPVDQGPTLWSPSGTHRVQQTEANGSTTLELITADGLVQSQTTVAGVVSHLRWASNSERVTFTLNRPFGTAGIVQDLFVSGLVPGTEVTQLTDTGAAFGADWLGAAQSWRP